MKRLVLAVFVFLIAAAPALAQRKTEAEERTRFETLLTYAKTSDPPSRHTAHEDMVKFGEWIEPELLGRLDGASVMERQLYWSVLYDRRCRASLGPAMGMLPEAIDRLRTGQIAAHDIARMRQEMKKAEKEGNNALVDQLDKQIHAEFAKVPWTDIQRGDEVFILSAICADFGREEVMRKLVDIAIQSSMDDSLAKGFESKYTRTHRDKLLPGGTEMWNTVYSPVWEALEKLATRALDLKVVAAEREKLTKHFEKLEKAGSLGPNQEAALQHFKIVKASMLKTEKKTKDPTEEEEKPDDEDNGGDPDVKIIRG